MEREFWLVLQQRECPLKRKMDPYQNPIKNLFYDYNLDLSNVKL
jgi:hypothetical protein